jgi:hypothetical protein
MKEQDHYSLKTGHFERGQYQKFLKLCQKEGLNQEQIEVIKDERQIRH